jgi:hypothetical protein
MNSDPFLAILAMDAYNRTGGDVTTLNLVVPTQLIGDVKVDVSGGDNFAGFFAQSYVDQATGQKIIAYRGTDTSTTRETIKDVAFGWSVGAGLYSALQAKDAALFFQQVATDGNANPTLSDLYNANVVLTGHSLGRFGRLCGKHLSSNEGSDLRCDGFYGGSSKLVQ